MNEESHSIFAPKEMQERVADLIDREKEGDISVEEKSKLDRYLRLEHLMRLHKASRIIRDDPMD